MRKRKANTYAIESSKEDTGVYTGYTPSKATQLKDGDDILMTVLGQPYEGTLYKGGSLQTYKVLGNAYDGNLYTTSAVKVTPIGTKYSNAYTYDDTRETYESIGTVYKAGSEKTYYTRSLVNGEEDLYWSGGKVNVYPRGNAVEDTLYYAGKVYSGGLYVDYMPEIIMNAKLTLATLKTKDITALTI